MYYPEQVSRGLSFSERAHPAVAAVYDRQTALIERRYNKARQHASAFLSTRL